MNLIEAVWSAVKPNFLGGDLVESHGSVWGQPEMGTTADLQKATGEIRVHSVRTKKDSPLVTLELLQAQTPGDSREMVCVQLDAAEAGRLGRLLRQAAEASQARLV